MVRHKWFVFIECCKLGIPWRGITHDFSKLKPNEFFPYVNYFYNNVKRGIDKTGYYKHYDTGNHKFDFARLLHQKKNDHHWQWWILIADKDEIKPFPMSDSARKEMLADWIGAGKALGTPDVVAWYTKNKSKMTFHPDTQKWIEEQLEI